MLSATRASLRGARGAVRLHRRVDALAIRLVRVDHPLPLIQVGRADVGARARRSTALQRSHDTMSSPVWSKNSSGWRMPRFTIDATISQYDVVMRKCRSSSVCAQVAELDLDPVRRLELGQEPLARASQLGLAADVVEVKQQIGVGGRGLAHGILRVR